MTLDSGRHDTSPARPRCLGCDYLLNDLPETRCPECGRQFSEADLRTFHRGRPMPPWLRSWVSPIGWRTLLLAAVAWLGVSRFLADPELNYMCIGPILCFIFVWPALLVLVGARVAIRAATIRYYGRSPADFGSEGRQIAWVLAAFLLLHASTIVALPTRLWFLPFYPAFEAAADEMRANTPEAAWLSQGPPPAQTRWIGPWHVTVQGVWGDPGVVAFYTSGGSMGGGAGFVHVNGRDGMIGYNRGSDGWIIGDWHYFVTD